MIHSFGDTETEKLFVEETSSRFWGIARVALRKLIQLNQAEQLADLAVPPGNRLEPLKDDMLGLHSVRINGQWRIVFRWSNDGAWDVSIVDYH